MACTCHLRVHKPELRAALGVPEILEFSKAFAQVKADTGQLWKYFTTSVYPRGDLPAVATREALQNGIDAIRAAVRAGRRREGEGVFSVVWDKAQRSLSWEDNGIGMDVETVQEKFLSLGSSGKRDATGQAGGFGVAKAVILGVSPSFRWTLHTRNNLASPNEERGDVPIEEAPYLDGTKITVYDVPPRFDTDYDFVRGEYVDLEERLRLVLAACDLPGIELRLNGERVTPLFNRRGGARVRFEGSFGPGTTAQIKAYRRTDRGGGYYVRLGGLYQFHAAARRGKLPADVVIDLTTETRPGEADYPLTVSRMSLQGAAAQAFEDLSAEVEQESESAARSQEYDIFEPDDDEQEDPQLTALRAEAEDAVEDSDFRAALQEATKSLVAYQQAMGATPDTREPPGSAAPRTTPQAPELREEAPVDLSRTAAALAGQEDQAGQDAAGQLAVVRSFLGGIAAEEAVEEALTVLEHGSGDRFVVFEAAKTLQGAVDRAAEATLQPGGAGLIEVAAAGPRVEAALGALLTQAAVTAGGPAAMPPPRPRNPFGRLAGLRVSKKNYDSGRAYRFKKNYARHVPLLLLWDLTLRLVANLGQVRYAFKPGFVLDNTVNGLAAREERRGKTVIYLNPDVARAVVEKSRERPAQLAYFLHSLACHELTHLEVGLGEGHGEQYASNRESLARATAGLLPAIEEAAVRFLKLPVRETVVQKALRQCEARLARARGEKPRLTEAAAHAKATRIVKQRIIQFDSDPARHEDAAKLRAAFSRYRDRVKERLLGP